MTARHVTAVMLLSYVGIAVFQTWPLSLHLSTHLTGIPGGDAGVYVWNTWVFRHELVEARHSPFWTSTILPLEGPTNLGLHNYTVFANLLTLPMQPLLGVVAAFNLAYIINVALSGIGMFMLARRLSGRITESWIAGAAFACAPFLVARGASHFSLAAAAPLPFFVYWIDRAWHDGRPIDAVAAGATLAWAAYCDPYYAVYCVMLATALLLGRIVSIQRASKTRRTERATRILDVAMSVIACLVVGVNLLSAGTIDVGPFSISMRTLYTPMLALTVLALTRLLLGFRITVSWVALPAHGVRTVLTLGATASVLIAPLFHAILKLASESGLVTAPVLWRSSAPGVDLVSFLLPNPIHPAASSAVAEWLARQPGRFDENVVALSFVALGVIVAAWRRAAFRPAPIWIALTVGFALLAMGPFIHVAGVQTFVPTPWALLRYVPVIGEARMPQRFGILVFLGLMVMLAGALAALSRRYPEHRRLWLAAIGVALAIELWPVPRPLYAARVPAVYQVVAADPRPVRVIELPFGIRDGLSSIGDFSALSQFYQTTHHKGLVGGYLSRVNDETKTFYRGEPTARVLMDLSEGLTPPSEVLEQGRSAAASFITDTSLGYVVVDTGRTSPALLGFAIEAFGLERLGSDGPIALYRVR